MHPSHWANSPSERTVIPIPVFFVLEPLRVMGRAGEPASVQVGGRFGPVESPVSLAQASPASMALATSSASHSSLALAPRSAADYLMH